MPATSWAETNVAASRSRMFARFAKPIPCARCGQLAPRGKQFCGNCDEFAINALNYFAQQANAVLVDSGPLTEPWTRALAEFQAGTGINPDVALARIQVRAADYLRQLASFAMADGVVTDDEMAEFLASATAMHCPPEIVNPLLEPLRRMKAFSDVRAGILPRIQVTDLQLPWDEPCHLDVPATLDRHLKSGPVETRGRLLITSRKLRFVAPQHGFEVPWPRILNVIPYARNSLALQTSGRAIPGTLRLQDRDWAINMIDTLIRIDRRQVLTGGRNGRDVRAIPQHVKAAVWQRDQGRCVECGADSYLEFDHVIPWSQGGASSVDNLQLLRRGCNARKGNKL